MAAAYLVKYTGPGGRACPDAVVIFDSGFGEDIAELAPLAKRVLVDARGGLDGWNEHSVDLQEMRYLGPWFEVPPRHHTTGEILVDPSKLRR